MLSARLINYNFLAPVYAIKLLEISLFLFFNMTFSAKEVRKANFSPAENFHFNGKIWRKQ